MVMTIYSKLIWDIVNFLVLIYLLQRFLYKPLLNIIDERRQKIHNDLAEADESKKKAAELAKDYQAKIKHAKEEAQAIISNAEKRGNERREEIVAEAKVEAQRMKERAMEEIKQARRQALSQVRDEVSNISLLIAEKFIQESMDKKRHQRLVDQFIDQLDSDKLGEKRC